MGLDQPRRQQFFAGSPLKPQRHTREYWDWTECTVWVERLLGYPIRDTLQKWKASQPNDIEYRDFWHYIVNTREVHNGGFIWLEDENWLIEHPWQRAIVDCYLAEFGEGPYWVEW